MSITSVISNQEWSSQGFREKFGDSLFKTDSEKRLAEYAEADVATVKQGNAQRLQQAKVEIEQKKDVLETASPVARALDTVGAKRELSARSVAESFQPAAGADLRGSVPVKV